MMKSGTRAADEDISLSSSKKRKFSSDELGNEECCGEVGELPENFASPVASRTSGCGSRTFEKHDEDESSDVVRKSLRSRDLENGDSESKRFETENSTSIIGGVFSRESSAPTSERSGDSDEVLSMKRNSPATTTPCRKIPPAEELEAFFAAAEKWEQKRFAEKYNYDIVKDVPLEGNYHWVRLYP